LETIAMNRKPLLTTFGIISTIVSLVGIIPGVREYVLIYVMISSSVMMMLLLVIYTFLIKSTTGDLRKKTIIGFLSMLLLVIAIIIDGQFVLSNPAVPKFLKEYLSPIIAIVSMLTLVYSKQEV
jgi:hypothetical protein